MNHIMFLYIDPGTGSMLFSLFIGLAAAASFGVRALFLKLKFIFSGGKNESKLDTKNIPFVIFSDHKRYQNVFKPICDEFEKRGIPLVYYTASADDPILNTEYKYITAMYLGEGNKPYAKLNLLKADILLATTPGLGVYQWKRSKGVKCYVHIPHSADELAGYRMFALDHYDSVLVTGENQREFIQKIEELRPSLPKKEIVIAGYPVFDEMKKRILATQQENDKQTKDKKTVLLAPSWGKSGILSLYGERLLSVLVKTDFDIIIRPHPQTVVSEQHILKPLEEKFPAVTWNYDNDNFEVLNNADILITDFSGIIFDFALLFDKPLLYTDPADFDTMPYEADWLSEPRWSFRVLPKIGIKLSESNFSNIEQLLRQALNNTHLMQGRSAVRDEAWQNRGNAVNTIVNYLLEKQSEVKSL